MKTDKRHRVIEPCPNCKIPNPAIKKMLDGSCGVCAGSGKIEMIAIGKII